MITRRAASPGPLLRAALAVLVMLALGDCSSSGVTRGGLRTSAQDPGAATIVIVKRGWHIDVGFAVSDLRPPLRVVREQVPRARYLLFGLGDRRYLTARVKSLDALLAAVRPGASLILLTGLRDTPAEAFGARSVRTLALSPTQQRAAQHFIWQSLARPSGSPVRVQRGPYQGSAYLAGLPRYSGLHTCNTWAAQVLSAAGLPVHARGVVFAWQLWLQVRRVQRAELRAGEPLPAGDQLQGG